jgi:hypothetical protein
MNNYKERARALDLYKDAREQERRIKEHGNVTEREAYRIVQRSILCERHCLELGIPEYLLAGEL